MKWLSGYKYREKISIGATNYQVLLKVHSGSNPDLNKTSDLNRLSEVVFKSRKMNNNSGEIYLNNQCSNFPHDIKFTDVDGITKLDYLMTDIIAPDFVWVNVKYADKLVNKGSFYIYYGKTK